MFSFFNKKEPAIKTTVKVWADTAAKCKACLQLYSNQPGTLFIAWFEDTVKELKQFFENNNATVARVLLAREVHSQLIRNAAFVFVERHPLKSKEQQLFEKLDLKQAVIYCSLDEGFFKYFGGEKIQQVIKTIGNIDDGIEHSLITSSIQRAQEKIEKQLLVEQSAHSQKEWMERNVK